MDGVLFWLHIFVIIGAVASGFFLPFPVVIVLIAVHKIHLAIFGDCLLTLLKRYRRAIASDENFLQYAARKLFGKEITRRASDSINYLIYALTIFASLSRNF